MSNPGMESNRPVTVVNKDQRFRECVMDLMRFTEGYFDRSHRLGTAMISQAALMYDFSHRVAYSESDISETEINGYFRRGVESPKTRVQKRTNDRKLQERSVLIEDAVDLGQLVAQIKAIQELQEKAEELASLEPQIPSLLVIDKSENHRKAEELDLELLDSSVIMELDIDSNFQKRGPAAGSRLMFVREPLPFSQDFMDVYAAGFVNNEGFGYNLAEDTIEGLEVFREIDGMTEYGYIAYMDGKPVSIVSISVDEHGKAYVNNVATDPEVRGQGISRALMEHVIEDLSSMGVEKVGLYTEIGGLEGYYNSIGFESLGVVHNFGASLQREISPAVSRGNDDFVLVN